MEVNHTSFSDIPLCDLTCTFIYCCFSLQEGNLSELVNWYWYISVCCCVQIVSDSSKQHTHLSCKCSTNRCGPYHISLVMFRLLFQLQQLLQTRAVTQCSIKHVWQDNNNIQKQSVFILTDKMRMTAYPCEGSRGVKYAGAQGFVPVVEADHVECDSLRYRQDEWQNPNRNNDKDCGPRNADTLHSAPGGHSSVPVTEID